MTFETEDLFEQEFLKSIRSTFEKIGFIHVKQTDTLVQAWVEHVVEDQDWKVPVFVNFVPSGAGKRDERALQIYIALAQNVPQEKREKLVPKINELNDLTTLGCIQAFPTGDISYVYRLPVRGTNIEKGMADFRLALQMMLVFVFTFYLYILVVSEDADKITLEQYLEMGV